MSRDERTNVSVNHSETKEENPKAFTVTQDGDVTTYKVGKISLCIKKEHKYKEWPFILSVYQNDKEVDAMYLSKKLPDDFSNIDNACRLLLSMGGTSSRIAARLKDFVTSAELKKQLPQIPLEDSAKPSSVGVFSNSAAADRENPEFKDEVSKVFTVTKGDGYITYSIGNISLCAIKNNKKGASPKAKKLSVYKDNRCLPGENYELMLPDGLPKDLTDKVDDFCQLLLDAEAHHIALLLKDFVGSSALKAKLKLLPKASLEGSASMATMSI